MSPPSPELLLALFKELTEPQQQQVLAQLRRLQPRHPLEERLNLPAEAILAAIDRDPRGLTLRMLRGVIAEAAFGAEIGRRFPHWLDITPPGDLAFDFKLTDNPADEARAVRVQVKLQRSSKQQPLLKKHFGTLMLPAGAFVVETQKTRGGIDVSTGERTRPYRFGEFDILAVAMQPATNDWTAFQYTVANWLLPRQAAPDLLEVFQPVMKLPSSYWTADFEQCVAWLRAGEERPMKAAAPTPTLF